MRKALMLTTVLILVLGLAYAWAVQYDAVDKIALKQASQASLKGADEPANQSALLGNPADLISIYSTAPSGRGLAPEDLIWKNPYFGQDQLMKSKFYEQLSEGSISPDGQGGIITEVQVEGEDCTDPFVISSLPYTDTQNSDDFLHDYKLPGKDVVYELNLAECMTVTISLCNSGDIFDSKLWLFPGDACGGTEMFTGDDECGEFEHGEMVITIFAGVYYILVDAYTNESGSYTLDVSGVSCGPAPANDDCADAIDLGDTFPVEDVCGTTLGATIDCPGVLDFFSVWYSFDVPLALNDVVVDYCPSVGDLPTIGLVLYDFCPSTTEDCEGFILAYSYTVQDCENGSTNALAYWRNLPGPATYYLPVHTGLPMDFCFDLLVTEPCVVECPPGAFLENEPVCFDGYDDDYNSGCNGPSHNTIAIEPGDTVCGESGTHENSVPENVRDTDWYRLDLGTTQLRGFEWVGVADFPLQLLIIDAGSETCLDYAIVASDIADPCDTLRLPFVGIGVYWLWMGPQQGMLVECGNSNYVAWVYEIPPLQYDAYPVAVNNPQFYRMAAGSTIPIQASVSNLGIEEYTFDVDVSITGDMSGEVFAGTAEANLVTQADTVVLDFGDFTSECIENYTLTMICQGIGDENQANDTLRYQFKPHAFGMDTYHDGSSYWVYPLTEYNSYAIRYHVPSGYTADLSSGLMMFFAFASPPSEQSIVTPWVALSDVNGDPDHLNPEWTSPTTYTVGPVDENTSFPVSFDLSSVGPFTEDFWLGFTAVAGVGDEQAALRGEGQFAEEDAPDCNRVLVDGVWNILDNLWANPTDVAISCEFDLTGGNYKDGGVVSIDSPLPAVIGNGPHEVLVTFANNGLADVTGATANVTITGPGGEEFNVDSFFDITFAEGTEQVDFGDWTADLAGVTYTIEVTFDAPGDQDICNDAGTSECFVIGGEIVYEQDFEANNGNFTRVIHSGPNPVWQWGEDTEAGYPISSSATKVWGTILNGDYPNSACSSLRSPLIGVPANGGALVIYFWYEIEAPGDPWDFGNVKIKIGSGSYELLTPFGGYDAVDPNPGNLCTLNSLQPGFNGSSGGWVRKAFDLVPYAGQTATFSIDFAADAFVTMHGLYLDDFTIYEYPAPADFAYLAGDANMYNEFVNVGNPLTGPWRIGGDVTFLVNFFDLSSGNQPCLMYNPSNTDNYPGGPVNGYYFASGDATGEGFVTGGDVTRLVNYFASVPGSEVKWYGWDKPEPQNYYPPQWLSNRGSGGLQPVPPLTDLPAGWPNCQLMPGPAGVKVIPSGQVK